jgi:hypothetical protein
VASKFGLDLEDVAVANLQKTADRWLHLSDGADFFDSAFPPHEQLPRHATFEIVAVEHWSSPREVDTGAMRPWLMVVG